VATPAGGVEEFHDSACVWVLGKLLQDDLALVLDVTVAQARRLQNPPEDARSRPDRLWRHQGVKAQVVVPGGGVGIGPGPRERSGGRLGVSLRAPAEERVFEEMRQPLLACRIVTPAKRCADGEGSDTTAGKTEGCGP
jgi:hypothetical protein